MRTAAHSTSELRARPVMRCELTSEWVYAVVAGVLAQENEERLNEAVLALGLADVLGRLRAVLKEFDKWESATYMHHDCRILARRAINETLKAAQDAPRLVLGVGLASV
jgi:hypothetical protein